MTIPQQTQVFIPNEHGFFDDLVTMLVSLSSYMFAMHVSIASNNPKPFTQRPLHEWMSYIKPIKHVEHPLSLSRNASDQDLIVFPAMLLMHLSLNSWPQFVEYKIVTRSGSLSDMQLSSQGNSQVISRIVGASFTSYYSSCESIIKTKYGAVPDSWPETLRFSWVIRNGFAHGGRIRISDRKLRPVAWKIWSFDYQQDGMRILFEPGMLGIGDIVTLMQEIDGYVRP
jgi:hypothetical protein